MDEGLLVEIGIAVGLELARHMDLTQIPRKEIVAHNSDIRLNGNGSYEGLYVPYGLNQFVVGSIEEYGKIFNNSTEAIEYIVENTDTNIE